MRQTFIFTTLLACLLFISCKKQTVVEPFKDRLIGSWSLTKSTELTTDDKGSTLSSKVLDPIVPPAILTLLSNGVYYNYAQPNVYKGTWEPSTDETKIIYDKAGSEERYYKVVKLTSSEFSALGPYKLNNQQYFAGKLYQYDMIK